MEKGGKCDFDQIINKLSLPIDAHFATPKPVNNLLLTSVKHVQPIQTASIYVFLETFIIYV
jgi:hypothetical protein